MRLTALAGIPEIEPGQDLADTISHALAHNDLQLLDGDIIVLCQKIVSKAENRYLALDTVEPGAEAAELARRCGKDPRLVELVLRESSEIVRCVPGVLIARHRLGFVVANAAIDHSNIADADRQVLLLPENPDRSAAELRTALAQALGVSLGVLICDSFGRPFRLGVCGVCIGCAGIDALQDRRGAIDRFGVALEVTQVAAADALCAAAVLMMGEADEGRPIVICSGVPQEFLSRHLPASSLVRPREQDLFR